MSRAVRAFALGLFCLSLMGCTLAPPAPDVVGVKIDGLEFENRSSTPVDRIELMVSETGNFVSCGRIAPGARCAARFPDVTYSGFPIEVKWSQGGAEWSTGAATLYLSEEVVAAGIGAVRVVVLAPGSAGVLVVPDAPDDLFRTP